MHTPTRPLRIFEFSSSSSTSSHLGSIKSDLNKVWYPLVLYPAFHPHGGGAERPHPSVPLRRWRCWSWRASWSRNASAWGSCGRSTTTWAESPRARGRRRTGTEGTASHLHLRPTCCPRRRPPKHSPTWAPPPHPTPAAAAAPPPPKGWTAATPSSNPKLRHRLHRSRRLHPPWRHHPRPFRQLSRTRRRRSPTHLGNRSHLLKRTRRTHRPPNRTHPPPNRTHPPSNRTHHLSNRTHHPPNLISHPSHSLQR